MADPMIKQLKKIKILIDISAQNKIILIIISILLLLPGFQEDLFSGQIRLPVKDKSYSSAEDEVGCAVDEVLDKLYIDEVMVCIQSESSLTGYDSSFSNLLPAVNGSKKRLTEVLLITQANISQEGISHKVDDGYFSLQNNSFTDSGVKTEKSDPNNILTTLTMKAGFVDIKTGDFLGPLDLEVSYKGGPWEKSKKQLLKSFREKLTTEFKRLFWLSAEIRSTKDGIITVLLGSKQGIKKEMIFELVDPDRIWKVDDEEFTASSRVVGYASVIDTRLESCDLKVLRQWENYYEGSWVVEHFKPIYGLQLTLVPPVNDSYLNIGIHFHAQPIQEFDFGLGIHFSRLTDSFNNNDYGFGFTGFGVSRFINRAGMDFGGKLGLNLDIPFTKDDDGQVVSLALFSADIGILAEIPVAQKFDFVINAGYRFSLKADDWEFTEDEETYSAYWENNTPEVDISGFVLSVGFKFMLF